MGQIHCCLSTRWVSHSRVIIMNQGSLKLRARATFKQCVPVVSDLMYGFLDWEIDCRYLTTKNSLKTERCLLLGDWYSACKRQENREKSIFQNVEVYKCRHNLHKVFSRFIFLRTHYHFNFGPRVANKVSILENFFFQKSKKLQTMALIIAFLSKGLRCFLWSYLLRIHLQNIAVSYFPKVSMGCLVFCLFGVTLRKKNKQKVT